MHFLRHMILAAAVVLAPLAAFACEPALDPAPWDRRIHVADDGSFQLAARNDNMDVYKGNAVVDLGHQRVGQRLYWGGPCGGAEFLLVVDCGTGDMVEVTGVEDYSKGFYGNPGYSVDLLYKPVGPIDVFKDDVPAIIAIAEKNGLDIETDVLGEIAKMRPRNRFDPFWGCKKFYPDVAVPQSNG